MAQENTPNQETNTEVLPEGLAQERADIAAAAVKEAEEEYATNADDIAEENAAYDDYGHSWDNINAVCEHYDIDENFANQVFNPQYIQYEKDMGFTPEQADKMRIQVLGQAIQRQRNNENDTRQYDESMDYWHATERQKHFGNMTDEQFTDKVYIHNLGLEANSDMRINLEAGGDSYEVIKLKMMHGAAPSPNSAYASKGVEFNSQVDNVLRKHGLDLNASDEEWHNGIMAILDDHPKEFDLLSNIRKKYYGSLARR